MVSALKWRRSAGSRQGRRLSTPMVPFFATAAMIETLIAVGPLHRDRRGDRGMRLVVLDRHVLEAEVVDRARSRGSVAGPGSGRGSRSSCSRACSKWLR